MEDEFVGPHGCGRVGGACFGAFYTTDLGVSVSKAATMGRSVCICYAAWRFEIQIVVLDGSLTTLLPPVSMSDRTPDIERSGLGAEEARDTLKFQ